jgi:hypothetical protein
MEKDPKGWLDAAVFWAVVVAVMVVWLTDIFWGIPK